MIEVIQETLSGKQLVRLECGCEEWIRPSERGEISLGKREKACGENGTCDHNRAGGETTYIRISKWKKQQL